MVEGRVRRTLQRTVPIVVSVASLGWVITRFDLAELAAVLDLRVFLVLGAGLLLYGASTLLLESLSLIRLIGPARGGVGAWTAAKIKCASYLLAIVNYALGGAALSVLLRRRAGIGLGEAASVVLLISLTDLSIVLALGTLAAAASETGGPVVRSGLVAVAVLGFFGGLVLLRMPGSLGPLDRLRSLSVFDALRRTPLPVLAQLFALRLLFTCCFVGVSWAAFLAFDVEVGFVRLIVGVMVLAIVGALPIAVSGLGTGQIAALYVFEGVAPPETLVALSLVLSCGLISLRAAMGLGFAREYTREALEQARREAA